MATSSITKQFIIKDEKTFRKLKKELDNAPERKTVVNKKSSSLSRGREGLKKFLSH